MCGCDSSCVVVNKLIGADNKDCREMKPNIIWCTERMYDSGNTMEESKRKKWIKTETIAEWNHKGREEKVRKRYKRNWLKSERINGKWNQRERREKERSGKKKWLKSEKINDECDQSGMPEKGRKR